MILTYVLCHYLVLIRTGKQKQNGEKGTKNTLSNQNKKQNTRIVNHSAKYVYFISELLLCKQYRFEDENQFEMKWKKIKQDYELLDKIYSHTTWINNGNYLWNEDERERKKKCESIGI